jgi:hypothetical protein
MQIAGFGLSSASGGTERPDPFDASGLSGERQSNRECRNGDIAGACTVEPRLLLSALPTEPGMLCRRMSSAFKVAV